jgi:hypothetical protein
VRQFPQSEFWRCRKKRVTDCFSVEILSFRRHFSVNAEWRILRAEWVNSSEKLLSET